MLGPDARDVAGGAWGQFGRITSLDDLPASTVMAGYLKKAMQLNDDGITVERTPKAAAKPVRVPADLAAALKKNRKASAVFAEFSPTKKRDYVEWVTDAGPPRRAHGA